MKKILKNKKKILAIILPVFFLSVIFILFPEASQAGVRTGVTKVLGWIMFPFMALFGKLAVIFLNLLVKVAAYNNFIHSPAVTNGWVVVRDLCNMFFVLILLVIAFASILRIDSYNLKTWLPKLVIMTVLINFSKLICGIFIDFTQVIMLTFVNAFKDMAGANLTQMLGITDILSFSKNDAQGDEQTFEGIIGSVILALIFIIIACVVILTMLVMLIMRVIMIWIYVVLSPLAYLLASFPQGQQYSQKWWSDFSKNLIIGPVLAFFIWLSFASMGSDNSAKSTEGMIPDSTEDTIVPVAGSAAGAPENIIKYIVSIGMLLGGMMIAQEMGGQAGKVVGKGMGKLQAMGTGALKMGKRVTRVERAENAYKSYKQQKESKRQDLAQRDAGALLKAEGRVKEAVVAKPAQAIGNFISKPFRAMAGVSDKSMKKKEEDIKNNEVAKEGLKGQGEQLRTQLDGLKGDKEKLIKVEGELKMISDLEQQRDDHVSELETTGQKNVDDWNIKKNDELDDFDKKINNAHALGDFIKEVELRIDKDKKEKEYNDKIREVEDSNKKLVQDAEDDYNQRIQGKEDQVVTDFNSATGKNLATRADVNTELPQAKINKDAEISFKEADISANDTRIQAISGKLENDQKDLSERKKKVESVNKWSAVVAGGVFGAVVGGPLGALVGGAIGGAGRNKVINAGNDALDLASNYNSSQIGKYKEKMKDEDPQKLRDIMNDYSKNSHERGAATMSLMERGELSKEEARVKSGEMRDSFKNDNKVLTQLDGALNNNYQELSKVFSDLKSNDPAVQEKANEKIVRGVITGDIKMHGINDQESLNLIIPKLAEKMTPVNFKSMYNGQTTEKRDQIKKSLTISSSDKSKEQLVSIQSKLDPLGTDDKKLDYLSNAGKEQIASLTDSIDGLNSLADVLKRNTQLQYLANTKNSEEFRKVLNSITKKAQFNTSNNKDKALLDQIMRAVSN